MLRVLVGTLFSGEREYERCLAALKAQRYMIFRHFAIEHLPERAAHEQLYERFMEHAHDYDLFLKLDADMVLIDEQALGAAVNLFQRDPHLDHATFTVHDWMTDSAIIGMHMYRNRATWPPRAAEIPHDAPPRITGRRVCFRGPPSPLALHAPDPSPAQALRFGLHRALAAFQSGAAPAAPARPLQALGNWRLLKRLWRNFQRRLDPRMGLGLLGVEHVLTHPVSAADCNYTNPRFWQILNHYAGMDPLEMIEHLRRNWSRPLRRELIWSASITRQLVRRHRWARRPPGRSRR